MKALTSQGTPMFGIDAGERRDQRAGEARKPGPEAERDEAHQAAVDAEPARERPRS